MEDGICVVKWNDKQDVMAISSEYPHLMIDAEKKETVKKYLFQFSNIMNLCLE